jgi:hypothetical protein
MYSKTLFVVHYLNSPNGLRLSRLASCANVGSVYNKHHRRRRARYHLAEGQVGYQPLVGRFLLIGIPFLLRISLRARSIRARNSISFSNRYSSHSSSFLNPFEPLGRGLRLEKSYSPSPFSPNVFLNERSTEGRRGLSQKDS